MQRTPGVACFNPFDWPVLDGKPLAFLGYGDEPGLSDQPDVRAAVAREFAVHGVEAEASPYALIFKEIDGSRYRVVLDSD